MAEKNIGHPPKIEEATTDQIHRYFSELRTTVTAFDGHPNHPEEKRPLTPGTICRYYTSLSAFFNWTIREEIITGSPMKNIPRPRVPKFMPDPFSEAEIRALLTACNMYKNFKVFLKQAGLPDICFHDLRHTAATLMLQQGVHPKVVQERLGHADISLTLNTYSHVIPSMQDEAAEKLDEFLTAIDVNGEIKRMGEQKAAYTTLEMEGKNGPS